MGFQIDRNGELFLEHQEGYRDHSYLDDRGFLTGGMGHKLNPAESKLYPKGTPIPQWQIDKWVDQDLTTAENCINTYITAPLNQNKFDALCSLVFNIGWGNFHGSGLMQSINRNESPMLIEAHWLAWGKEDGVIKKSLMDRRHREFDLFLKPIL